MSLNEILKIWYEKKDEIERRLDEFKSLWKNASDEELFAELAFCLLTPQSKATVCWRAIEELRDSGILFFGSSEDIVDFLTGVRFKYTKAKNIVSARTFFSKNSKINIRGVLSQFSSPIEMREFLVANIRGMGYKEASHFLRNIGLGESLAILDRHILKNLVSLGVIDVIPKTLTKKKYLEIEEKMRRFAKEIGVPMAHLDLVLWFKEAGLIFK
ncbi:N-glycosylase/DNA lyase [Candidatus Aciduliprofundum boonei]|uniref:8-oxoguanine DNA glycosylase/AP lyase n=1 Tax=Aciduliprofundum boonei (strain DSM 19572 / T469) TaxID=439481 RepID=D3TCK0_ACIB4|nr:N-glycosylase/DNA lyase [Candidatus Aciduliprofundum boonei]ADD08285.1 DNA-(apurinic or apyrimidinic site) lyase [Aciduliprofundum boonei T469]HII54632.1 N-glycosylase/DNA lyase [Candidatus Aciduliprofundum boonei]